MTKNLFKWMMALAIVASPMVFTACGDDDDNTSTSGGEQKTQISYTVSGSKLGSSSAISEVWNQMLIAMCQSVGQTFDSRLNIGSAYAITIAEEDENKMLNALDAAYAQLKDTDLGGSYLKMTFSKNGVVVKTFEFGSQQQDDKKVSIGFENQQLNSDNYWVGDGQGMFSYTEEGVTVTGTFSVWDGGMTSWSGFAISGRKEKAFDNLTPDQYNSAYGGTIWGDKFLVVQAPYNDYECLTFDQPVKVLSMYCTNSAYSYSSMTKGDSYAGDPFTVEDWFSGFITCFNENGDTISTTEVKLAEKDLDLKKKYLDYWHMVRINAENVKKIKFSFAGSRTGEWGLNTPSYMCVDKITVERQ